MGLFKYIKSVADQGSTERLLVPGVREDSSTLVTMAKPGDPDPASQVLESLVLGVISWWTGKFHRNQVLDLVTRHFQPMEVFEASSELARVCNLELPGRKNNTATRSACEAYAIELVNTLLELDDKKIKPRIVIPCDQLGKVPLEALADNTERSVSARLESLETCIKEVTCTMNRMLKSSSKQEFYTPLLATMPTPSAPPLEEEVVGCPQVVRAPQLGSVPQNSQQTYASVAGVAAKPLHGGGNQLHPPKQARERSKSPSVKRKSEDEENSGFKKPGRPRKTTSGASKVSVEGVGTYQPSLQYYIGNTPGKANSDVIKKVLDKCSEPLLTADKLEIEEIELLTQEENPRTKCWRVAVPYRFMSLMENPELYPQGWRSRKFFGSRKGRDQGKKPRLDVDLVDQVMKELDGEKNQETRQPTEGGGLEVNGSDKIHME